MPILSQIGRRHWKTRLLVGVMYLLLVAGAVRRRRGRQRGRRRDHRRDSPMDGGGR